MTDLLDHRMRAWPARRPAPRRRQALAFLAALPFTGLARGAAAPFAQSRFLYAFGTHGPVPIMPMAGLIQADDGFLYGTTQFGGRIGNGTVYRMSALHQVEEVCSFGTPGEGSRPLAKVLQASDGMLYGTTYDDLEPWEGTIYRVSTSGDFETMHRFSGPDGAHCKSPLIQASDGKLYGTAWDEGPGRGGCIFRMSLDGVYTLLHALVGETHGGLPVAGLVQGSDGLLYGTASSGGPHGHDMGTIFTITLDGTFRVLHTFSGGDGANPSAELVEGPDGRFYGTASYGGAYGGGTLFRVSRRGEFELIWSFDPAGAGGAHPSGPLLLASDGHFYGVAANTVFRLGGDGTPHVLQTWPSNWSQVGELLEYEGSLIGLLSDGGPRGGGAIYQLFAIRTSSSSASCSRPAPC